MSVHYKMAIPLLGWGLKLEDVDRDKGFRGVFSYDINRPSLDHHIFLMYSNTTTGFSIERDARLKSLPTFYSRRRVKIKGITFLCYTFIVVSDAIRSILSNTFMMNDGDRMRIFKFWNFTDDDVNNWMLHQELAEFEFERFEQKVIPEWDYIPEDWE